MWKAIVTDSNDRAGIQRKTAKLFNHLSEVFEKEDRIGLLDGYAGYLLLYGYYAAYEKNMAVCDEQIGTCFEKINTGISDSNQSVLVSNGLSGVLWCLNHLYENGIIDIDDSYLDAELICQISFTYFENKSELGLPGCLDYLHGITGIIHVLCETKTFDKRIYIDRYIRLLNKLRPDKEQVYWEGILHNMNSSERVINLGLPHGNTSIVIVLATLLKISDNEPQRNELRKLLDGLIAYIKSCRLKEPGISGNLFPGYIIAADSTPAGDRLAWCYGDLCVAVSFYRAGVITKQQELIDEAIAIFVHSAGRKNVKESGVNDAAFCHGALGLAHLFNRFYQYTGREELKTAALFWLEQGLQMFDESDPGSGLNTFNPGYGYGEITTSLLDGTIGIALILISMVSDLEPCWDEVFLLSEQRKNTHFPG